MSKTEHLPKTGEAPDSASSAKAAESARLKKREHRAAAFGDLHLRLLEEYGPPSVVVNETYDIVHLSQNAGRYLRFVAGEPTANITKVVRPDLQSELRTALHKASHSGQPVIGAPIAMEIEGTGESVTVEVRPVHANDAAEVFYLIFFRNELASSLEQYEAANEQLKRANEALQAATTEMHSSGEKREPRRDIEERFRLLVEGTPDYAMFLLDADNKITFWSSGAEKIFGWTAEEAVGQTGNLIFTPEDQAHGAVEREIGIALREGRAPDRRWHLRKDGLRLWLDGVMRRLDHKDGSVRGFAKIARDATEQHRVEEELRYARDQLEQRVLERTAELVAINHELERAMKHREQLERELLEISERERRRIGQDLHDVVCQELTATALFLKSTSNRTKDPAAARTLSEAAEIVNRNVAIARDLARGFQPSDLTSGGLIAALRALCRQANQTPTIHCHVKLPKSVRIRDETIALNLYRIAQEAMRNSVTHSNCSEIVICMERERDHVRLVIEDDGKGFRFRKRSKGLGLHIMKYRANILGGTLMIDPRPRGGTKVTCEIPVKNATRRKK